MLNQDTVLIEKPKPLFFTFLIKLSASDTDRTGQYKKLKKVYLFSIIGLLIESVQNEY
jgi:hypothetical protein